ncbi:MAG: M23 family metallopeptidase [Propionibacteriaceae bacterium]|jgi:murein DD-endopeptidase MepM/ murein hydrolase activator NlpD|nr:M23 family metallopeptidase [Propionibacteriaceae bacterium]
MRISMALAAALVLALLGPAPGAVALTGVAPLPGPVVRRFDPPAEPWFAGHRGVDLLGTVGEVVAAAAAGEITFAGKVAGKGVVTVSHGELRTTYEPVSALVAVGAHVHAGEPIATLQAGHSCPGQACLHWGLKRADEYLDPLSLLGERHVRLLPASAAGIVSDTVAQRGSAISSGAVPGLLSVPAQGELGSPFGMRLHPIFNEWRMHEGQDISAPCGAGITAAADGVVKSVGYDESGGNRLVLSHGQVGAKALLTHYLHAEGYIVKAGDKVLRGQKLGTVGSTGWSTGCHLHFSVSLNGVFVDPKGFW